MKIRHLGTTPSALLTVVLLTLAVTAVAAPPPGYYDSVDMSSVAAMRASVHAIIDNNIKIPYTSSSTDTWDVLEAADQDPYNSTRILDLYKNHPYVKQGGGNNYYNREHSWPNSYGFPDDNSTNLPYTDCHHLFLCDMSYNSARGNRPYGNCQSGCSSYYADSYDGQSGVNYAGSGDGTDIWETWAGRRGDVARAMFYMDVRYEGDGVEPDLILTDDPALIQTTGGSNASVAYMGLLSVLLEWNDQDPVDDKERDRNDVVYSYQGNRNPFIDHPEWVSDIFADGLTTGAGDAAAARPVISLVHPNPFNPITSIDFRLTDAGPASVIVYTLDGRRVRTLLDGASPAGTFTVRWDGRDDGGAIVGSGAYLCRLVSGSFTDSRKLVLLK